MKGITFGTRHSYNDFGMILTSKDIGLPEPKLEKVDVLGRDGELDLTDAITDVVKFKNRKLSFEFTIKGSQKVFLKTLQDVSNFLHGLKTRVILDDDPSYYYFGRCTVNQFKTDKRTATIIIDVDAEPYKKEVKMFEQVVDVVGDTPVTVTNLKKTVSPTFDCSSQMMVRFKNKQFELSSGIHKVPEIKFQEGDNLLNISGNGTVTIKFERGVL